MPCIGLLHGDADTPQSRYHPFRLDELVGSGVDLWLLGHIHKPSRLNTKPEIRYLGSPQAMSAKESGAHGPVLVEVSKQGQISVTQVPLSPVWYGELIIEVTPLDTEESLRDRITSQLTEDAKLQLLNNASVRHLVYKLRLTGEHTTINEVDHWVRNVGDFSRTLQDAELIVRKITSRLRPALQDLKQLATSSTPVGILAQTILEAQQGKTTPFLEKLIADWKVKAEQAQKAGTYKPLADRIAPPTDDQARQYLLNECNRLLAELHGQLTPAH